MYYMYYEQIGALMNVALETPKTKPGKNAGTLTGKSYVTVSARVNADIKTSAQSVLEEKGLTVSIAVQRLLEHIAVTGDLPFGQGQPKLSREEIKRRLGAFKRAILPEPCNLTDDEIRQMRLKEKYGLHFDD
jgi:addiction module RelB/DinJ family antitoxin